MDRSGQSLLLPTFAELAEPERIPAKIQEELASVDPDALHPRNLFRVHWHNGSDRRSRVDVPGYFVVPEEFSGIAAPILVALGNRFPMIRAHKVLAAYACLVPRIVTGQFDPGRHRAIWPSTGNYCRGGIAISGILGCRGVAVLPEGMSEERFRWLEPRVGDPADIVRTPGSESNVKEVYDECARLGADPSNVVFNQFSEFGNHLAHWLVSGKAMERIFRAEQGKRPGLGLAAFVSATGSAGTIAAGDHLKERFGSCTVAAEPIECPTLLYNGFGEHNIQGIGDKHVPLIHNVMNTDIVTAISDRSTDSLYVLFHTEAGRDFLVSERGFSGELLEALDDFGLSSLCNVLAAIKVAKQLGLGESDAILTVATDGAEMYRSELGKLLEKRFPGGFDPRAAARVFDEHLTQISTEHLLVCSPRDQERIFNLGYFTWVEQQGVSLEDFEARRSQDFWQGLRECVPVWDSMIQDFNRAGGVEP
ncbi:MAG: pyridoxal-5'-phosphate-dependent protein subunit beta [Planctomycetota bacterium]